MTDHSWKFSGDTLEYSIEAISYLSTYAQSDEESDEIHSDYGVNRDTLIEDCRFLYEAAKADQEVCEVLHHVTNIYNSIFTKCIEFHHKVQLLFSSIPASYQKQDLEFDEAHPSVKAVLYLQHFAQQEGLQPDSPQVEKSVKIVQHNLTRIAHFASSSRLTKRQYTRLQRDFDEILEKTVDFTNAIQEFRDEFPSLV